MSSSTERPSPSARIPDRAPPSYDSIYARNRPGDAAQAPAPPPYEPRLRPIVVPQTSSRPPAFGHAYAPALAEHGISRPDFLAFIAGLNGTYAGRPAAQQAPSRFSARVLRKDRGESSVASHNDNDDDGDTSARNGTAGYLRSMAEDLFGPAGLDVSVCTTDQMLRRVGMPAITSTAHALLEESARSPAIRMNAIQTHVAPLELGAAQTQTQSPTILLQALADARGRMAQRREMRKAIAERREQRRAECVDRRTLKLERKLARADEKLEKRLGKAKCLGVESEADEKKVDRVHRKRDEKVARLGRRAEKRTAKRHGQDTSTETSGLRFSRSYEPPATGENLWIVLQVLSGSRDQDVPEKSPGAESSSSDVSSLSQLSDTSSLEPE